VSTLAEKYQLTGRFVRFLFSYRWRWFLIVVCSCAGVAAGLAVPYLGKLIVDYSLANKNIASFISYTLLGGAVFIIGDIANRLSVYMEGYAKLRITGDLRQAVFVRIQRFPLSWFENKSTGQLMYTMSDDTEMVATYVSCVIPHAITIFPRFIGALTIVFMLNWKIALVALLFSPFICLPSYFFSKRIEIFMVAFIHNSEHLFKEIQELLSHIHLIKVFGKEEESVGSYSSDLQKNIQLGKKQLDFELFSGFIIEATSKFAAGVIAFYGGYQVIRGELSLGSMAAISVYFMQLIGLQGQVASFFQSAAEDIVSCKRISAILDEPSIAPDEQNGPAAVFDKGMIEFRGVTFGYQPHMPVLNDVTLTVAAGSHVAVVGASGCGKTTLLYLAAGVYTPLRGNIFIDKYDINRVSSALVREQIGFVLQEPFLWNDTIEYNIRYGKPDASREEVEEACSIAGVTEFITSLPFGMASVIGESGCTLSEGQKQKIAVARALIRNTRIIIFDEAMSSMDSLSEESIMSRLKERKRGATVITVSHRLSTVMAADAVYYCNERGKFILGLPGELLRTDSSFRSIFGDQIKHYA